MFLVSYGYGSSQHVSLNPVGGGIHISDIYILIYSSSNITIRKQEQNNFMVGAHYNISNSFKWSQH